MELNSTNINLILSDESGEYTTHHDNIEALISELEPTGGLLEGERVFMEIDLSVLRAMATDFYTRKYADDLDVAASIDDWLKAAHECTKEMLRASTVLVEAPDDEAELDAIFIDDEVQTVQTPDDIADRIMQPFTSYDDIRKFFDRNLTQEPYFTLSYQMRDKCGRLYDTGKVLTGIWTGDSRLQAGKVYDIIGYTPTKAPQPRELGALVKDCGHFVLFRDFINIREKTG